MSIASSSSREGRWTGASEVLEKTAISTVGAPLTFSGKRNNRHETTTESATARAAATSSAHPTRVLTLDPSGIPTSSRRLLVFITAVAPLLLSVRAGGEQAVGGEEDRPMLITPDMAALIFGGRSPNARRRPGCRLRIASPTAGGAGPDGTHVRCRGRGF
jgi:hypothetical protein